MSELPSSSDEMLDADDYLGRKLHSLDVERRLRSTLVEYCLVCVVHCWIEEYQMKDG